MSSNHVSTRAEETAAERLRRTIGGRPVAILLHGPSIRTMQRRIGEFGDIPFSYASLNFFRVMEEDILSQINRDLDFVLCCSEEEFPRRLSDIEEFLSRSDDKVLITTQAAMEGVGYLLERHRHQILFTTAPKVPREELPNSATILIQTLVRLSMTPRIILFGADGMAVQDNSAVETYFGKETLRKENRDCCLVKDTLIFNTQFAPQLEEIYGESGAPRVDIANCNPDTLLTPLPTISHDELRDRAQVPTPDWRPTPLEPAWIEAHESLLDGFLASSFSSRPRHMRNRHEGYQLVLNDRRFYGFAPYLGTVNFSVLSAEELADYQHTQACFISESLDGLREQISNREAVKRAGKPAPQTSKPAVAEEGVLVEFSDAPIIIDEDYSGYVLFAHEDKFFAVTHDVAVSGLGSVTGPRLNEYIADGRVIICNDLATLKDSVGSRASNAVTPPAAAAGGVSHPEGATAYFNECLAQGRPYFGPVMAARQGASIRHAYMTELIRALAAERKGEAIRILEIGSWAGGSAITWAEALKGFNRGAGAVFCVDPWRVYYDAEKENAGAGEDNPVYAVMTAAAEEGHIFDLFMHNIRTSGNDQIVVPVRAKSDDVLPLLADATFDVVFVDGDHSHDGVMNDLQLAARLLKPGGVICGDDLELQRDEIDLAAAEARKDLDYVIDPLAQKHYHPGVTLAVGEFFGSVSSWEGFWAMRRGPDGWKRIAFSDEAEQGNVEIPDHLLDPQDLAARRKAQADAGTTMVLDEDFNGYVLFVHDERFFAVSHTLNSLDLSAVTPEEMSRYKAEGLFFEGDSLAEVQTQIEAAAGAQEDAPPRPMGACNGYNLVEYANRVFAVPVSLGDVDLSLEKDRNLPGVIAADRETVLQALSV